jgi:hypothetical protein
VFRSKTLFIVGAGASQEAGLPTGIQLTRMIAEKLDIRYDAFSDPHSPKTGDRAIASAIVNYAKAKNSDPNLFLQRAWKIRDAMPQAISIDNFIDAHSSDPGVVLCGKLGITQAILESEQQSKLYFDERPGANATFDHTKVDGTWYLPFFKLLTENLRKEKVDTVFDNVSFITFNYDRCIEHYLYHALQNYYDISDQDTDTLMGKLQVLHPYGVVGRLPWQDRNSNVSFGGVSRNVNLLNLASQIKTFTEQIEDSQELWAIRSHVQHAGIIVYLGFAFHELNMKLLSSETASNVKRVFGTAVGISDADIRDTIVESIWDMLNRRSNIPLVSIDNRLSCYALFGEYWRTLSRG